MQKTKNTTIYDIANRVKVSPSTVSRVLTNASHPVSSVVREQILQAAKEMNYVPNAQARYLKTLNNPSIGVIIPSIDNPFYPSIVRGASDEARERNYSIYLANCDREYELTDRQIQSLLELNVQGILSIYLDAITPSLKNFVQRGGRLVSLSSSTFYFEGAHNIQTNKIEETRIAMRHLMDLGHRKIALLMNELNCQIRFDKVEGYKQSLKEAGIPFQKEYLYVYGKDCCSSGRLHGRLDADEGNDFVEALLERSPEVTAILCMNDIMALGVCSALRDRHYDVPKDYSVMGYDDAFFSAFCNPTITTVALKKYEWGRSIMRYLIDMIDERNSQSTSFISEERMLEPVHLIQRESTGAPRTEE